MKTRNPMRSLFLVTIALLGLGLAACELPVEEGLTDGTDYLPDQEVLDRVQATVLEETEGGGLRFGTATMEPREGSIRVVRLTGPTPYELGYQHGILLRDSINTPTFQVFSDPIYHGQPPPYVTQTQIDLELEEADRRVFGPMERETPVEYLEELKGIADGSGLDYKTVFRATFLSDYNMITLLDAATGSAGECSGVFASGPATSTGELVVGRNTDYEGQKQWIDHQVIFFYDYPGAHRYVKVTTAGLLKCNSAMNEVGMVVSGHFMLFSPADPHGYSFTIFENEIMRKMSSMPDVVALLTDNPRCGAFGLTVGDGKTGEALGFEATYERLGIREMEEGAIVTTNFAQSPEQFAADIAAKLNIQMRDVYGRYARLKSLVSSHYGGIDPTTVAEFMSDSMDTIEGVNRERGGGNVVCGSPNVTSVVFLPARGLFWIASGEGGMPACKNAYTGYDFWAELNGETPAVTPAVLPGYAWADDSHREGLAAYMAAELAYQVDKTDVDAILGHLAAARIADPGEPKYRRAEARFLLRRGLATGSTADLDAGMARLEQCLDGTVVGSQANNERAVALFYLGIAADLTGDRATALSCYREILDMLGQFGWRGYLNGLNKMVGLNAFMGLLSPYTGEIPEGFALSMFE